MEPWVRHGGTMLALARLQAKDFLSGAEYGRLASAYQFLRHLEHRLQFEDDLQTHTLPSNPEALELLAQRMPGGGSSAWLMRELSGHFSRVMELYVRVVRTHTPAAEAPLLHDEAHSSISYPGSARPSNVVLALDQQAPALAAALGRAHLQRGYRAFEH